MVGIVLTSHGQFAQGILQSGSMIFGEQENVQAVTFLPGDSPSDLQQHLQAAVAAMPEAESILFLVDLWGGTPFNQVSTLMDGHEDQWAVVTGLNLPMLIEAYASRLSMQKAAEIAVHLIGESQGGIRLYPENLAPEKENTSEPTTPAINANIGAPGKFTYVLARIDSRLLHGQVATAWTKTTKPTRIIVVSDAVAQDKLRKNLIAQAAPVGVKAHVVPIKQMIKLAQDEEHFGGQRALLLFETPQDALRAIQGGVPIQTLNVGSMAHSAGKVQPNKVLAFDQNDLDTFQELADLGVKFDVRKVPNDSPDNMDAILKKAQAAIDQR
ncbi:PTS mannose transporter subunit IIAB [Lactobacillus sp. DCY120]|uniref:PTS system mannose-specific EIIAB component n=1 Tax=Bombilactobacillus apium TaxID=2675299 RepID=A0A850QVY7_9LACO|nr:mannose/fructose/sorbose PTS transporter subunit IIA [Bombilactobacillus apium]NVY95954.1 PTS mannose transporter subunit IIAB [Bombilactobacillus apium]